MEQCHCKHSGQSQVKVGQGWDSRLRVFVRTSLLRFWTGVVVGRHCNMRGTRLIADNSLQQIDSLLRHIYLSNKKLVDTAHNERFRAFLTPEPLFLPEKHILPYPSAGRASTIRAEAALVDVERTAPERILAAPHARLITVILGWVSNEKNDLDPQFRAPSTSPSPAHKQSSWRAQSSEEVLEGHARDRVAHPHARRVHRENTLSEGNRLRVISEWAALHWLTPGDARRLL